VFWQQLLQAEQEMTNLLLISAYFVDKFKGLRRSPCLTFGAKKSRPFGRLLCINAQWK
jgi:hypothetical protein